MVPLGLKQNWMKRKTTQTLCELNPCLNGATCQPISNEHKCICAPGYYGKLCNVSYESCGDLLNAGYNKTGIYSIKPAQSDMLSVYCDQTSMGGGWTMVFKVVSGVAADIEQLWSSADSLNEDKTEALDISSSPPEHYKNRLVPNWQTVNPTEARVALYENNNEAFSIVFDAVSSDNMNWFSANRVNSSPWTDLISNPPAFFSIPGSAPRPFYISEAHFGCETDAGWLVVGANVCLWETRFSAPTVMYSKLQHSTIWSVYGAHVSADFSFIATWGPLAAYHDVYKCHNNSDLFAPNILTFSLIYFFIFGWFSIECRKTKTKVITLTNHNRRRHSNEPIRTQSKYM